jgi:hypothetical protein
MHLMPGQDFPVATVAQYRPIDAPKRRARSQAWLSPCPPQNVVGAPTSLAVTRSCLEQIAKQLGGMPSLQQSAMAQSVTGRTIDKPSKQMCRFWLPWLRRLCSQFLTG